VEQASASKTYTTTDALKEKERDEVEGFNVEGSKEDTTSKFVDVVLPRHHEYIIHHAFGGN
jgi:hypothetical protein